MKYRGYYRYNIVDTISIKSVGSVGADMGVELFFIKNRDGYFMKLNFSLFILSSYITIYYHISYIIIYTINRL